MSIFSEPLLKWFNQYGRKELPWQIDVSPYHVWVSEIMLQQTQVKTVIPYYKKFIKQYPDIAILAQSSVDGVLSQWTGLGYYARARNLHKTAQIIQNDYKGKFPADLHALNALPGIGLSTAGAILSLSMRRCAAILDGNCKRVYARYFKISGQTTSSKVEKKLWKIAWDLTPEDKAAQFNQAMMDLGSMVCSRTKPSCLELAKSCPLSKNCRAFQSNSVLNYPEKKPGKKLPEKSSLFVIILSKIKSEINNNSEYVFLEKRAATGIWGGLWCFPEFADLELAQQWLDLYYPDYSIQTQIKPQQHTFSHFRLNYSVLVVKASIANKIAAGEKSNFFSVKDSLQLGLATPIKKLLNSL